MKKKFIFIIILLFGTCFTALPQKIKESKGFHNSYYNGKSLVIHATNEYIEITPYTADIIRFSYKFDLEQPLKSYSTIVKPGKVTAKFTDGRYFMTLKTSALKVLINKDNLSISLINKNNDTLSTISNYIKTSESSSIDFHSDGKEAFYGGGSNAIDINKRGCVLENYNQAHWDYKFGETNMNIAIPFLVSTKKYGIFMDNPVKSTFDVCKTNTKLLSYKTSSALVNFFFIAGAGLDEVVTNYTWLTGRQPLPPRWALGYISSRYSYKSESEITGVIDRTMKAGIPIDAVVFDLNWYKSSRLMGNHNWYRDSFPDPEKMLTFLLNKGIKVVTISETYVTKRSENFAFANEHHLLTPDLVSKPEPHIFKKFWAGPAGLLDIFKPESQKFYWDFYKARINEGTGGWWLDLGEPELSSDSLRFSAGTDNDVHNLYPLVWTKTVFDGYRKDFPKSRIFILPRSGYAGMQRYSVFPWSGDVDRSFEGLKAQIPMMLNMGLGGVGYMHSDAGGFSAAGTLRKDAELYSRWLEFAAFTPVMRTHADATLYSPEPIFWDDVTRKRVTNYIRLRYSLLPYNYTLAYTNTTTGRPLMLPVNYFEPGNKRLGNINDEYLWGDHLLVSPVIVKGQTVKRVLFPKGEWIGFNDLKSYKDSANIDAPVDSLPLFVKAGSIIPMAGFLNNTEQYNGQSVIFKYYPGDKTATVKSQWFFDNGTDPNSLKNRQYDLVDFISNGNGKKYFITINPRHLLTKQKHFSLIIAGKYIKSVTFSKKTKFNLIKNDEGLSEVNFNWTGGTLKLDIKTL